MAYKLYTNDNAIQTDADVQTNAAIQAEAFKKAFSIDVKIKFLGVWYISHRYRYEPIDAAQGYRKFGWNLAQPDAIHQMESKGAYLEACCLT